MKLAKHLSLETRINRRINVHYQYMYMYIQQGIHKAYRNICRLCIL